MHRGQRYGRLPLQLQRTRKQESNGLDHSTSSFVYELKHRAQRPNLVCWLLIKVANAASAHRCPLPNVSQQEQTVNFRARLLRESQKHPDAWPDAAEYLQKSRKHLRSEKFYAGIENSDHSESSLLFTNGRRAMTEPQKVYRTIGKTI